jgi:hypothetical protein
MGMVRYPVDKAKGRLRVDQITISSIPIKIYREIEMDNVKG